MSTQSKLSTSRLGRLGMLGKMAGGIAGGFVTEGARQLYQGNRPALKDLILTPDNLNRLGDKLSEMRGAAMKVGQLLSMDSGHLLPAELSQLLARLRDNAHTMPLGDVANALNSAWGENWDKQFKRFNFTPIAAASIGQVHHAVLNDGRQVAVKIQYPKIRQSIDSDVDNVATLLKISRLLPEEIDIAALLDEAKLQLHREADYSLEASAIERFSSMLGNDDRFEIPNVIGELSNSDVLTMTYLDGVPIDQIRDSNEETRNHIATALLDLSLQEVFNWGLVQTDPNFANYLYDEKRNKIQLLDFGATREYSEEKVLAFKQLLQACMDENEHVALEPHAANVGYLETSDTETYKRSITKLLHTATEPVRSPNQFSFHSDTLADRMREIVLNLRRKERFARIPPVEILFLHRKLGGLYLLFSHFKANIAVRQLITRYV